MTRNTSVGLMSSNRNERKLNIFVSINWRASLVPAAAVIPAPIAYIKFVAVKKLVVGFQLVWLGPCDSSLEPEQSPVYLSCFPREIINGFHLE